MMNEKSPRPRVFFITTGYPTDYRPYECIFVHRSIKALSNDIQAQVIHLRAMRPGRPVIENRIWDGINVLSISCPQFPFGSYSHFNTQLMKFFAEPFVRKVLRSADLIHGAEAYPAGYVAGKWANINGKPFTFNVIGSDLYLFLRRNHSKLGHQWLKNLQGVACNSDALRNDLHQLMGKLPNSKTIYRGIKTDEFSLRGEKAGPQASFPPVRYLYLGGFHTWDKNEGTFNLKGGQTLLQAWKMAENRLPTATLAIGGPGVYREQIDTWKASLRRSNQIYIIGRIDPEEVPSYIRSSDVVIIPSLSEGLPNIAKEALSCGRPVLGTKIGGIPEVVENGINGLLVAPDDPGALANGIIWFFDNQEQIALMGINGRKKMVESFSWEQYRQQMLDFFKSAMRERPMEPRDE